MVVHPSFQVWTDYSVSLFCISLGKRYVELFYAVGVQAIEAVVVHGLLLSWRSADIAVQKLWCACLNGAGMILAGGHHGLAQVHQSGKANGREITRLRHGDNIGLREGDVWGGESRHLLHTRNRLRARRRGRLYCHGPLICRICSRRWVLGLRCRLLSQCSARRGRSDCKALYKIAPSHAGNATGYQWLQSIAHERLDRKSFPVTLATTTKRNT